MRCLVAFSAVGSLIEELKPRDFLVPDQVIDRTKGVSFDIFNAAHGSLGEIHLKGRTLLVRRTSWGVSKS